MDKKTKKQAAQREGEQNTICYTDHNTFCFKCWVSLLRPLLGLAEVVEYIEVRRWGNRGERNLRLMLSSSKAFPNPLIFPATEAAQIKEQHTSHQVLDGNMDRWDVHVYNQQGSVRWSACMVLHSSFSLRLQCRGLILDWQRDIFGQCVSLKYVAMLEGHSIKCGKIF